MSVNKIAKFSAFLAYMSNVVRETILIDKLIKLSAYLVLGKMNTTTAYVIR